MKKAFLKNTLHGALGIGLIIVAAALAGCQTPPKDNINFSVVSDAEGMTSLARSADEAMRLAKGDNVIVTFAGQEDLRPHEETIKEDGTITLEHIQLSARVRVLGARQRPARTGLHADGEDGQIGIRLAGPGVGRWRQAARLIQLASNHQHIGVQALFIGVTHFMNLFVP